MILTGNNPGGELIHVYIKISETCLTSPKKFNNECLQTNFDLLQHIFIQTCSLNFKKLFEDENVYVD